MMIKRLLRPLVVAVVVASFAFVAPAHCSGGLESIESAPIGTWSVVVGYVVNVKFRPRGRGDASSEACELILYVGGPTKAQPKHAVIVSVRYYRYDGSNAPVDLCVRGVVPIGAKVMAVGYEADWLTVGDLSDFQQNVVGVEYKRLW